MEARWVSGFSIGPILSRWDITGPTKTKTIGPTDMEMEANKRYATVPCYMPATKLVATQILIKLV